MKGYPKNLIMRCPFCSQKSLCEDWKNGHTFFGFGKQRQRHKSVICPRCYEHLDTQQWNLKQWLVGLYTPG